MNRYRLRYILSVGLLCLLSVTPAFVMGQVADCGATKTPDHVALTWTGNPSTTQTISWRTDTTVGSGVVQYQPGDKLSRAMNVAKAEYSNLSTDLGTCRLFKAVLIGLKPNTRYTYRVGDGENWSESHSFQTANPNSAECRFLIFGDSQSGSGQPDYKPWQKTVQNAYADNKDAKFMVNCGDLVEVGQNCAHWNEWFASAKGVVDSIPEMAVQGNHETYLSSAEDCSSKPTDYIAQFPLPQNGPVGLKNQVYSYDYGNVHLVVLDSQQEEEKPKYGDILETQKAWLDADLAASKATWKVVFFHKTPYDLKASRSNEEIKKAFCLIMERHHVDVVFNAHDHGVARTYAIHDDIIVNKPSQGTIYYVVGRSGKKTYSDLAKKRWDAFFFDPQDQPNYLTVNVVGEKLTVKVFKQDHTLLDTFTIDKERDVDSDTVDVSRVGGGNQK